LAELLIVLAVLGLVGTFTIPKVLTAVEDSQNKAVLKETVSLLSTVAVDYINTYGNIGSRKFLTYLSAKLNYSQLCTTFGGSPCVSPSYTINEPNSLSTDLPYASVQTPVWAVMTFHNGALITSLWDAAWEAVNIVIDANGEKVPNVIGKDQLCVVVCLNTEAACNGQFYGWVPSTKYQAGPGRVYPSATLNSKSLQLYDSLFQ
jgi:type II secretory pathway pseudopilin PulG